MAFKKGKSGNPSGRPPGAKDKKSEKIRKWLLDIVENRRNMIADDLDAIDPATRLNFIAKILPYVAPRLASVDMAQNGLASNAIIIQEVDAEPAITIVTADEMERKALEKMARADGHQELIVVRDEYEKEITEAIARDDDRRGINPRGFSIKN